MPARMLPLTPEQQDLLARRTLPFLDKVGLSKPLSTIMQEVYLQGMRDAIQMMEDDNETIQ